MASETEILRARFGKTSTAPTATPVQILLVSKEIVAANGLRKTVTLQNNGTEPCICRCGGTVSTSAYNFVLAAATGDRDGDGGSITLENYTGAINGICEANDTDIAVLEVV